MTTHSTETEDICTPEHASLLTLEAAKLRVLNLCTCLGHVEAVEIDAALGRVVLQPPPSLCDLPNFRNSAMDGYAFSSQDISGDSPFSMRIVGQSMAGHPYSGLLNVGECVRITTGAVLPPEADTVVIQEEAQKQGDTIVLTQPFKTDQNVRHQGEDLLSGSTLLNAGKVIGAADIALLAACGLSEISVSRKINIGIAATGDELEQIGQTLRNGQIYDSNSHLIRALLNSPCFSVTSLGIIRDDINHLGAFFEQHADRFDVLITSGGVSVGDADYVKEGLSDYGMMDFWKIAIKPGKPLAFGRIKQAWFFGLPGNPVAVAATLENIVLPALMNLCGASPSQKLRLKALCLSDLRKSPGRMEFQRGVLRQDKDGNLTVHSSGHQGSHILSSLSQANCFIVLESESRGIKAGTEVWVEPFNLQLAETI